MALFTLTCLLGCATVTRAPTAERGKLDLSAWRFVQDGSVPLAGQWEIYWGKLLDPLVLARADAPLPDGWITLPSCWTGQNIAGTKLPARGVATFRLRLLAPSAANHLALWIQEQSTGYRLWFDGRMVAQAGNGPWRPAGESGLRPQLVRVHPAHRSCDVVLQVANSAAHLGGPTHPILLGEQQTLSRRRRFLRDLDALLFGSLMVMGLYHAGLFLIRRRETPALHIAVICLLFGVRIPFLGVSGRPLSDYVPGLPWELYSKAEAVTVVYGVTAILFYVGSVLRERAIHYVIYIAGALASLFAVSLIVLPRRTTELATPFWFVAAAGICCYVLVVSLRALLRGERVGWFLVAGWGMVATAGLLEIIMDTLSPAGTHLPLVPFGVFAFLLLQAWVIAHRLYAAFSAVETLSRELQLTNAHLRRLEALKDEFLANTSHELRTPVHGIVGLSEALLRGAAGSLSMAARESLELIVSSGRRLGALISDLLDLSRLQRDDIRLLLGPVDLRALGSAVVGLLDPVARARGLTLLNRIPELPPVRGDENRLHQLLVNLVGNAIKYVEHGEIRLSAAEADGWVQLAVTDNGPGIPSDQLELVFQREQRLQRSELEGIPGAGLGLTIARKLVELHGGTIRAENVPGGGSRFLVQLPVWPASASDELRPVGRDTGPATDGAPHHTIAAAILAPEVDQPSPIAQFEPPLQATPAVETHPAPDTEPESGVLSRSTAGERAPVSSAFSDWRSARVLVVDDDPVNLRIVESHLEMAGADVRTEKSGTEALSLLARRGERFDLVFLDVMMPGLSGYEVTSRVRERYAATELPVILLTARSQTSEVVHGFASGANDYLVKPFAAEELLARGLLHLGMRRAYRALKHHKALEQELERQRGREELARLSAERERLEKLRYQLNPHFLFNALASIRGAIGGDAEAAREMVGILGEYCRMALAHGQRDLLALGEELTIARLYLSMDQARRRDPIDIGWQIASDLEATLVPTFLLQPLVENAVKYGRRTCQDGRLRIRVEAHRDAHGALVVSVSNTGRWLEPDLDRPDSLGVGLENVRRRLQQQFGDAGTLSIRAAEGWVHAAVTLPSGPGP